VEFARAQPVLRAFGRTVQGHTALDDALAAQHMAGRRMLRAGMRLPGGWDAPAGEGGSRLSGGERQRISIARALLKNTPIVLFDEATAALDAENEHAVQQAMAALSRDRTVLVIAHRLHTLRQADHIVVLDQGRVMEEGVHDELLTSGGRYAHYWRERRRAHGWRLTTAVP